MKKRNKRKEKKKKRFWGVFLPAIMDSSVGSLNVALTFSLSIWVSIINFVCPTTGTKISSGNSFKKINKKKLKRKFSPQDGRNLLSLVSFLVLMIPQKIPREFESWKETKYHKPVATPQIGKMKTKKQKKRRKK